MGVGNHTNQSIEFLHPQPTKTVIEESDWVSFTLLFLVINNYKMLDYLLGSFLFALATDQISDPRNHVPLFLSVSLSSNTTSFI